MFEGIGARSRDNGDIMREKLMASLLVLGTVSAVSGTVAAVATLGRGASACAVESSTDDENAPVVLQNAVLKYPRALPVR